MQHSKRLISLLFAAASLTVLASPARAVETLTISGPSGTFVNDQVVCSGIVTTCPFVSTFSFLTPTGYNQVNGTISTSASPTSNIDFTSVFLNGAAFTLTPTGMFEFGTLANTLLTAGATNTLTVRGQNSGDGAFSGTLTFAAVSAVPEPGSWALMLLGFGAVGISMRRRRAYLMQAA